MEENQQDPLNDNNLYRHSGEFEGNPDPFNNIKVSPLVDRKCIVIIILSLLLLISIGFNIFLPFYENESSSSKIDQYQDYKFEFWNSDASSLNSLKNYMKDVCDPNSNNYIPFSDRIAVFDMDGTVIGEKNPAYVDMMFYKYFVENNKNLDNYTQHLDMVRRIDLFIANNGSDYGNIDIDSFIWMAKGFKNWTIKDSDDILGTFLEKDVENFNNLKFKNVFYKPMIEILNFLDLNSFQVYFISGSERLFVRYLISKHMNTTQPFKMDHCIGSDIEFIATGELPTYKEDVLADDHYVYQHNDSIIKSGNGISKNLNMGKVRRIIREIGKQPVLGFGNSNGDVSMLNYVTTENKYKSKGFIVVADDMKREYGIDTIIDGVVNTTNSDELKRKWESSDYGYQTISMRDDWKTIYGDNVTIKNNQ